MTTVAETGVMQEIPEVSAAQAQTRRLGGAA
jgi:hypothetical protein